MVAFSVDNLKPKQPKRALYWTLITASVFFSLLLVAVGALLAYQQAYAGKILPGVTIGQLAVGGQTASEAMSQLSHIDEQVHSSGVTFSYNDRSIVVTPVVISVTDPDLSKTLFSFNWQQTVDAAMAVGRSGNWLTNLWQQLRLRMVGYNVPARYDLNRDDLLVTLKSNFSDLEQPPQNAKLVITGNQYTVEPEQNGQLFNYTEAIDRLVAELERLDFSPIALKLSPVVAAIKKQNTGSAVNSVEHLLAIDSLTVTAENQRWTISKEQLIDWLEFQTIGNELVVGLNKEKVLAFLQPIAETINVAGQDARFQLDGERVVEFQASRDGKALNLDKSYELLNQRVISASAEELPLVVEVAPAAVTTGNVNNLGIADLLGRGSSNFKGSPKNRRHNIGVGVSSLNGILIKPDEEFSLLHALGAIDASNGYLQELVIKGDRTLPEYGGGLCQIGTTTFRAALASGLPITARRNHSYRVGYYEPPVGMDATIYDPAPDFKFVNDTGHYILFIARTDGDQAIFEFYGTSDGRVATTTQPVVYNIVKPGEPRYIETDTLAPGAKKQVERAHNGASASFDYTVTYSDGTVKKETFKSQYVPWKETWLVGTTPSTTEPIIEEPAPPVTP